MRPPHERSAALALVDAGENDCAIARRTVIPRSTIREWRHAAARGEDLTVARCPRCWRPLNRPVRLASDEYAELLGLYLGDGCLSQTGRAMRLRIALDARYPGIVADAQNLLSGCFPGHSVGLVEADAGSTMVVSLYWSHLPCLFPQHGPGKKHERRIQLEPWQWTHIQAAPWSFLRGCIRSDGCAFINRTGPYRYLTYDFWNSSADIRGLFVKTCRMVGVNPREAGNRVRINRRPCVALMAEHVGLKA